MGYYEDELAKTTDPQRIDFLKRLIEEDGSREASIKRMIAILKEHQISMGVSGCGCCSSPSVTFSYKGELIIDAGDCSFDTDGSPA